MKKTRQSRWLMTALAIATSQAFAESPGEWGQWNQPPGGGPGANFAGGFTFSQGDGNGGRRNDRGDRSDREHRGSPGTTQLQPIFPTASVNSASSSSAPWANTGDWIGYAAANGTTTVPVPGYASLTGSTGRSGTVALTLRPTNVYSMGPTYYGYGGTVVLAANLGSGTTETFSGSEGGVFRAAGYTQFGGSRTISPSSNSGATFGNGPPTSGLGTPGSPATPAIVSEMWTSGVFYGTNLGSNTFSFSAGQQSVALDMNSLRASNVTGTYSGTSALYNYNVFINVNFNTSAWTGSWTVGGASGSFNALPTSANNFGASGTVSGSNMTGTVSPQTGLVSGTVQGSFIGPMAAGLIGRTDLTLTNTNGGSGTSTLSNVFATARGALCANPCTR